MSQIQGQKYDYIVFDDLEDIHMINKPNQLPVHPNIRVKQWIKRIQEDVERNKHIPPHMILK